MEECITFLKSLNLSNSNVILGCSGGPDSMCLLHLSKSLGINVICAHVNHNIRSESVEEYQILKDYCQNNNIIFEGLELEPANHSESFYRKQRYQFYKRLAKKYNTSYIMTAHHGDDLVETVLMRITRGSNLKGYLGFSPVYKEYEYTLLKPLIFLTKDDILKYNSEHKINYFIDKTNETDNYTRNRYRHNILPFLKKENDNVHLKYVKFSNELREVTNYLDRILEFNMQNNYHNDKIEISEFVKIDKFIQKLEIQKILSLLYRDDINLIQDKHIKYILEKIDSNSNFQIDLPNGIICVNEFGKLYFTRKSTCESYNYIFDDNVKLPNGYEIITVNNSEKNDNNIIRINYSDIKLPLHVRSRRDGDRIATKNLNGETKIKKIFIDNKISNLERDNWPIVTDDNDRIIWVPGLKKSKIDIEKSQKCDIILKYIRKGEKYEKKQ